MIVLSPSAKFSLTGKNGVIDKLGLQKQDAEKIVGQELLAGAITKVAKPVFWKLEKKQSNAEVDFLFIKDGEVFPVEVKSGKAGTLCSLHSYIGLSGAKIAVRLYSRKYSGKSSKETRDSFCCPGCALLLIHAD